MESFGELLVKFTDRAGISDAELARSIGVQRQTIFRWKEGLVARPRYRDDVLHIATKLRLTPQERDVLLLAGGFPPDETPSVTPLAAGTADALTAAQLPPLGDHTGAQKDASAAAPASVAGASPIPRRQRLIPQPALLLGVAIIVMLTVALVGSELLRRAFPEPLPSPTAVRVMLGVPPTEPIAVWPGPPTPTLVVAAPDEKLLLVAQFVGYTSGDLRFNVAGRIQEALAGEIRVSQLPDVRAIVLSEPVVTAREQAHQLLTATGAAAVVWGEYDAGRVRANITVRGEEEANWVNPVDSPSSLALVINEQVPDAARMLALVALGRLYRDENETTTALAVFEKALAAQPVDKATEAALHFYIGTLLPQVKGREVAVLTGAIGHYSQALALQPGWENIRYNRGTAYLGRGLLSIDERGDLDAAIDDLSTVVERQPRRADPLINRGIAYYQRKAPGDLEAALADFTHAIELNPKDGRGYYHRGLAHIRNGDQDAWAPDLAQSNLLQSDHVATLNALCWGYGLFAQPEAGLPYCEDAVAADRTGSSLDSRAIVYGQLGRYPEAVADLESYLAWVKATYPDLYEKYRGPQVEEWIVRLRRAENPFTPELLARLRQG